MITKREVLPDKCANAQCKNKLGEGRFELVTVRTLTFMLCAPCANSLTVLIDGDNRDAK